MLSRLRTALRAIRHQIDVYAALVYLSLADGRIPWYHKALPVLVVLYWASPIDLIPDFIPVLGSLDDILLCPLGIWLSIQLIPATIRDELQARAETFVMPRWVRIWGAALTVLVWVGSLLLGWHLVQTQTAF